MGQQRDTRYDRAEHRQGAKPEVELTPGQPFALMCLGLAAPTACGRCGGLMVAIEMNELTLERESEDLVGWRCVSCGEILDPVILAHRECQQASGHKKRWSADPHADRKRVQSRPGSLILSGR